MTDGVNLEAAAQHEDVIDVTRILSNDIAAILRMYGVEAARSAIVREISGVFAVYGITVDYRHLSLIADYMTHAGGYRPFNRYGMASGASPLSKASFETTVRTHAAVHASRQRSHARTHAGSDAPTCHLVRRMR